MATSLASGDCTDVGEAEYLFATDPGLLILRPRSRSCCSPYFSVPSGCYALVTEHGADVDYVPSSMSAYAAINGGSPDVIPLNGGHPNSSHPNGGGDGDVEYQSLDGGETARAQNGGGSGIGSGSDASAVWPAGLHFPHPPWVRISHLVTRRSVCLDLPVRTCRTLDNVSVGVDVSLVFRIMGDLNLGEDPELVRRFVHEMGPRGLEVQLRDAQEEAVRALARTCYHTEVYGLRSGAGREEPPAGDAGGDGGAAARPSTLTPYPDLPPPAPLPPPVSVPGGFEKPSQQLQSQPLAMIKESSQEESTEDNGTSSGYNSAEDALTGSSYSQVRRAAAEAGGVGEQAASLMRDRLNRQFMPQGVQILSIIVRNITLPKNIVSQMLGKTMNISRSAQQRMEHMYAMQESRMEEEVATMMQTFTEMVSLESTAGAEKINHERVRLEDAGAAADRAEAEIRAETSNRLQVRAG